MAATDTLRTYRPGAPPLLPGNEKSHLMDELDKIAKTLNALISTVKQLDARMVANGF